MSRAKEEAEPLLLTSSGSHDPGTSADSESEGGGDRKGGSHGQKSGEYGGRLSHSNYDPLSERDNPHPTSNCDTMIHLLKGNIGTGILAMPDAFKNAGLLVGTVGTMLIGVICVHTMHMLVACAHELCRRTQTPSLGFAEVAELSFRCGPPVLRRFAPVARSIINMFLCVTQLGFCCVYFLFVAETLNKVLNPLLGLEWSTHNYMAFLLVPMILLNYIRNLKYLAPFSMIANLFMGFGLALIFYYIFKDPLPPVVRPDINVGFSSWKLLPLYFGTAIYAFEGIGMILPLENSMKNPQDFGGWNGVLNTSMIIVGCLYTAVGFFGYLKYGAGVEGSITLNLTDGEVLAESVRLTTAISIFLSYALQFYVPMDIMWPHIKCRIPTERIQLMAEYGFRTVLVILTFILAELIPHLDLFISLVGAVSSSTLALIFPPAINILVNWQNGYGPYRWTLVKDVSIMVFGTVGFIAGTYVSIENILAGKETPKK